MGELTKNTPKALLKVAGKTLLEHKLDILPDEVSEILIVVGYLGDMIRGYVGGEYKGKRILYVEEENPVGGTAHSLWRARALLSNKFLVMSGDNIYARSDIAACAKCEWAMLVEEKEDLNHSGRVIVDRIGNVINVIESEQTANGRGLANTGMYALDTRIFDYAPVPKSPDSSELGLPQTMIQAVRNIAIKAVYATFWIPIKSPDDLKMAEEKLENLG
jgi:NDP-sugar pyrophosphorylase family protein